MPQIKLPAKIQAERNSEETGFNADFINMVDAAFVGRETGADKSVKTQQQARSDAVQYAVPNFAIGAFSEVAKSMPFVENADVDSFVKSMTPKGMYENFEESREGYETAGAIGSAFIPILGITKLMKGKALYKAISKAGSEKLATTLLPSRLSVADRVAKIKQEASILAKKQQSAFVAEAEPLLAAQIKKEYLHEAFDTLKIGLGTDVGIYALLNESDFFFPEELSAIETAAFYGIPNVAISGISGLFMRYKLKNVLRDIGPELAKARNPGGLPLSDILAKPGNRSSLVTIYAAQKAIKENELIKTQGDAILTKNLNSQLQELDANLTEQIQAMALDAPISGVSKKWNLTPGSLNTIKASLKKDYTTLHEVLSLENYIIGESQNFVKFLTKKKEKIEKEAITIFEKLQKESISLPMRKKLTEEFDALVQQREFLDETSVIKLNRDGSMQLAANAKDTFDESLTGKVIKSSQENVKPVLQKAQVGDIIELEDKALGTFSYSTKFKDGDVVKYATSTDTLRMIIPESEVRQINNVNLTDIVDFSSAQKQAVLNKPVMKVMDDFHLATGKQGVRILDELSPKQQNILLDWGSDSGSSKLRQWVASENADFQAIYKAFEPARKKLHELADADGTITLFRGEAKKETIKQTNDVVPMTLNADLAKKYADEINGNLISKKVAVDDIIAVVGGKNAGDEFIVRGNANRNIGSYVTKSSYEALSFYGKTAVQTSMRHAIKKFTLASTAETFKRQTITPYAGMHHIELDALLEIADKIGRDNPTIKQLFNFKESGLKSFDDIEFASLKSKYKEWIAQNDFIGKSKTGVIKIPDAQRTKIDDIVTTLNLPHDGMYGGHPLIDVFNDMYIIGIKNIDEAYPTFELFKNAIRKSVAPKGKLREKFMQNQPLNLRGSQLKSFDEERNPVLLLTKTRYVNPLHREELIAEVLQQRTQFIDKMKVADTEGAELISQLTRAAIRDKDRWDTARKVDTLVEGSQIRSDRLTQGMFGVSNQPAIIAVDAIRDEQDKIWRAFVEKQFEPHTLTFNKILSHENIGDLHSFAIAVNQQGNGWRGLPQLEPIIENGRTIGYQIPLENHAFNKELFERLYKGQEFEDGLFIPQPLIKQGDEYKPLVISPLAAESLLAMNKISQGVLKHINYLRKLSGRPAIPRKQLHLPPKNLQGKELMYLINKQTGQLHTIKSGNTPIQVKNLADEEIVLAKKQGMDLFIATENEIANFNMIKLQAFQDMVDYSTTFQQTGAGKGKSFGQTIEIGPSIITNMQETLINQYATISKVNSAMLLEPEMRAVEFAAKTAGLQKSTLEKQRNIWNIWMNRALGNKSLNRNQFMGKFYGATEDLYDRLIQSAWDQKVAFFKGGVTAHQAETGFKALDKAVPGYNPFKDSIEFLENTMKVKAPASMLKHMTKLNNLTGLAMLRMFEIGLGLINIGTLPTLIPPVVKALQRQKGQSLQEWKALNAAWSSPIDENVAIWNPYRAFTSGMHFIFTDEAKKLWTKAAAKGHLWQETVERMQLFTAPAQGYTEKMIKHYTELSSMFVDKTEQLSRSISYGTFYNMAKRNLNLGDDAAMDFAHHMANRVIGDFRPNVRPQIFQGATGMPFGLFTTFAWNYLQRVFGYLEKGQFKSFMNQMGLQASFFGAKSLPGFNQYVEHFTSNYDGSENMVDRLDSSFGSEFTDALLFGGVGTLTGLATYTRTDIRLPGSGFKYANNIFDLAPAAGLIKQTYKGISESLKSIQANEGLNARQLSEIASRTFPIRALRGWIEVGQGQTIDSRGQVIDSNVSGFLDVFSRAAAIRTTRNQRVLEEFARQRSQQLRQMDIRRESRNALRSAFRANKFDGDLLNKLAEDYIRSGGEPADFSNFIKQQAMEGLVDKTVLRALETANDQSRHKDHMRLMEILRED